MNPFDAPPSGHPVSLDDPESPTPRPGRGRMALVALLTAGLVGGGIAGISQLVSADRPELSSTVPDDSSDETVPPVDDEATDETGDDEATDDRRDGEIVIDVDGDEPIAIDLGGLDDDAFDRLHECLGLPEFEFGDFDIGALEDWRPGELPPGALDDFFEDLPLDLGELRGELDAGEFGGVFHGDVIGDGSVTVAGPDGVSVVDLGENGSVTISKEDGAVSIETAGDATVQDLGELFGELGSVFEGAFDEGAFDEFLEGLPALDDLPEFEPLDPDAVRSCVDEVLGD